MAQWIKHRPAEQGIAGSGPAGVICQDVECSLLLRLLNIIPSHSTVTLANVTLAGLEPAIFGSEDQRLIH